MKALYEKRKSILLGRMSSGLGNGSALRPLLLVVVMDVISRQIHTNDALRKVTHCDRCRAQDWSTLPQR